jgi:TnpA family transposase
LNPSEAGCIRQFATFFPGLREDEADADGHKPAGGNPGRVTVKGAAPPHATFRGVFAVREFRAVWLSEILSVAGDRLALVAVTLLVYDRTRSPLLTALAYAGGDLPWIIGGLFLAGLADRYPRREDGVPSLKRRRSAGTPEAAEQLAEAVARRMPERSLLSVVAGTAYWLGWHHHFGPAGGSDPKIADPLGRYCMAVFTGGANIGPYEAARHISGVSARELSMVRNRHIDLKKLNSAIATVVNAFNELDVVKAWGDGTAVAADGTQVETYIDNLLAETSIRYGGVGGIAYHYISDTYVALFSRFIPCGVWEAVHLIEGLLANTSDIQPSTVHADTQGQSAPVFALATLFGFDLMPRIRNFKDLIFFRPNEHLIYPHVDALFGERGRNVIDWKLIERHWQDLMQVAISISEGRLSSATLMRRLRSNSRKNRIYKVFREVGRSVRTVALLRYLADPQLRARITAATNKVESYNGFSHWLAFGNNGVLADNDPVEQEKLIKLNTLLANLVIFHNALDIMDVVRKLVAEGWLITADQLGAMSPYLRGHISRFGAYATDDLKRQPEAFNPVLKEVDFTALGLAA